MMKVVDKMLDWENAGKIKLLSVGYSLENRNYCSEKLKMQRLVAQVEKLKSGLVKPGIKSPETKDSERIKNATSNQT